MIHELPAHAYEKVRPVFKTLDHNLAVNSIIAGLTRARIYVDDPLNPRAAITWIKHRVYLAGSTHNDGFNRAVDELFTAQIYPQNVAAGRSEFALYYAPDDWEEKIDVILRDKAPIKDQRQYFVFKQLKHDWRSLIPEGFTMQPVDDKLLAKTGLKNLDQLAAEMQSERHSVDDFLSKSFGFCLVHGDEIVAWCLSEYNSEHRCQVGIETLEGYRKRGLATLTASALVEHALSNGITTVGWHCWSSNHASAATAKKVGFEKARDYPVYYALFDQVANLGLNGNVHFKQKRYREALRWYEKAFQRGKAPEWIYWNAACASALIGERDPALNYLNQLIDHGFTDLELVKDSPHLESLHGTQGWKELLDKLAEIGRIPLTGVNE